MLRLRNKPHNGRAKDGEFDMSEASTVGILEFNPSRCIPEPQPGELVGREALAIHHGVSSSTVKRWLQMGLPHHGDQHRYVFYPDETDPWVEKYNAMRWKTAYLTDEKIEILPEDIVGNLALGKHYGVTGETIRDWVNKGMPCRGASRCRVYSLVETDAWVESYRNSPRSKCGRRKVEKR